MKGTPAHNLRIDPERDWVNPSLHAWLDAQQMLLDRQSKAGSDAPDPEPVDDEPGHRAVNPRLSHTA